MNFWYGVKLDQIRNEILTEFKSGDAVDSMRIRTMVEKTIARTFEHTILMPRQEQIEAIQLWQLQMDKSSSSG